MNPDQIKSFVTENYPELVAERRRNPDGWAFYHVRVQRGSNPTRIARVVQRRPGGPVMFKPAVSARLFKQTNVEVQITGGRAQVQELLEQQMTLWYKQLAGGEPRLARKTSAHRSESHLGTA